MNTFARFHKAQQTGGKLGPLPTQSVSTLEFDSDIHFNAEPILHMQ